MNAAGPVLGLLLLAAQSQLGGGYTGPGGQPVADRSVASLSRELLSPERTARLLAVRELNRIARASLRASEGRPGRDRTDDALSTLAALDGQAAPACILALRHPELVVGCATLLGRLETPAARGPLAHALEAERRERPREAIRVAIAQIDAAVASSTPNPEVGRATP